MEKFYDDLPIRHPKDDEFGYGTLAKAIADCIRGIKHPNGSVVAIHGPWGSGKSSLVHLVLHHLENSSDEKLDVENGSDEKSNVENDSCRDSNKDPIVISFNSWCYRHEEGIVKGFFRELQFGLPNSVARNNNYTEVQSLFTQLGFAASGALATEFEIDTAIVEGVENTARYYFNAWKARNRKKKHLDMNKTIEKLQHEIGEKLKERVLIVIDDIDRLPPEEAMAIFRLVKSVGRIKNVMYLLSYDRKVTEEQIRHRYLFEGDHYLEKIVQANFDMPEPTPHVLEKIVDQRLNEIIQEATRDNITTDPRRVRNVIRDVVMPDVRNIRDIHRLFNMLSVTYNAVRDDVDMADFIALETLRFFHLGAYQAIRSSKSILTDSRRFGDREGLDARIESEIIGRMNKDVSQNSEKVRLKSMLASIFPPIHPYNAEYIDRDTYNWRIEKRACSEIHFDTYFRFSVSSEVVSESEFGEFVHNAHDQEFVKQKMLDFLLVEFSPQRSKASIMLDDLAQRSEMIKEHQIRNLLTAIYSISDELQEKFDADVDFGHAVNNRTRIKWLSEKLFTMRFPVEQMSREMLEICKSAPLNLQIEYCGASLDHYHWSEGSVPRQQWVPFTKEDADNFKSTLSSTISYICHSIGEDDYEDVIFKYGNYVQIISDLHKILEDNDKVESLFERMLEISDDNVLAVAKEFSNSSPKDVFDLINPRLFMFKFHDLESRLSYEEDGDILRSVIKMFEEVREQWYDEE